MKKNASKSTFKKKNKTVSYIPESKQNSQITKTNSCIKMNSLNSQQYSKVQTISQTAFVKQPIPQRQSLNYPQMQFLRADKPNQLLHSGRNKAKSSIQTIAIHHKSQSSNFNHIKQKNQQLTKQNSLLKQKCLQLQEMSIRDKETIKNLIIRINEVKQLNFQVSGMKKTQPSISLLPIYQPAQNSASNSQFQKTKLQTPYKVTTSRSTCQNRECQQRKRYLQSELYRQRISRDRLQMQKKEWQRNREQLKQQYGDLLGQIRQIRDSQY